MPPLSAFWLAFPFLVLAVLLGLVSIAALFRAPRTDAVRVLSIFVSAFRHLAARTPAPGGRVELDRGTGDVDAGTESREGQ